MGSVLCLAAARRVCACVDSSSCMVNVHTVPAAPSHVGAAPHGCRLRSPHPRVCLLCSRPCPHLGAEVGTTGMCHCSRTCVRSAAVSMQCMRPPPHRWISHVPPRFLGSWLWKEGGGMCAVLMLCCPCQCNEGHHCSHCAFSWRSM
jgi:hypothetical protein